jgi:hypothetical protein
MLGEAEGAKRKQRPCIYPVNGTLTHTNRFEPDQRAPKIFDAQITALLMTTS